MFVLKKIHNITYLIEGWKNLKDSFMLEVTSGSKKWCDFISPGTKEFVKNGIVIYKLKSLKQAKQPRINYISIWYDVRSTFQFRTVDVILSRYLKIEKKSKDGVWPLRNALI